MKITYKTKVVAVAMLPSVFVSLASGAVIYSENADSLVAGSDTLQSSSGWNAAAGDYGVLDGGSIFTTNHFFVNAPDTNWNFADYNFSEGQTVVTLSADFVDLGTSTSADASVRLAFKHSPNGSTFFDINASATEDQTIIHFDYVFNTTDSAVTFEDGLNTIDANTVQLWADGELIGTKAVTHANSESATGIGIWSKKPDNAFLMDNLEVRDTAYVGSAVSVSAIPEPSGVLALGCLFGASMLTRRRS